MKSAPKHKSISWIPTVIGIILACSMIEHGLSMISLTDQTRWTYDLGDSLILLGFLWLARVAFGVIRLRR